MGLLPPNGSLGRVTSHLEKNSTSTANHIISLLTPPKIPDPTCGLLKFLGMAFLHAISKLHFLSLSYKKKYLRNVTRQYHVLGGRERGAVEFLESQ